LSAASVWITSSISPGRRRCPGRHAAAQRADHAGGHAARQAERVAHRDDENAHEDPVRVAELRRAGDLPVGAYHREVGQRVATDQLDARGRTVAERGLSVGGVADDLSVGDQVAFGGEYDGRARRLAAPTAPLPDAERCHARS